jgi:signal transduction histidine kinase
LKKALPDPSLVYSEVIPLSIRDARHPWTIWAGLPNSAFANSKQALLADKSYRTNLTIIAILTAATLIGWLAASRLIAINRTAATVARQSELEARNHAAELSKLNGDVTYLNMELAAKIKALGEAQDDIIRKGRMAQLGQLIATVAHEIRNPLGGIRTSAFLLRRVLPGADEKAIGSLERIDNGVKRCDDIITQLLDFSRTASPQVETTNLDSWVEECVQTEADAAPPEVEFSCDLGAPNISVAFDRARMRRALTNIINNACESMMDRDRRISKAFGKTPSIRVATRLSGRGAEISITDNGPGIALDVLARIREPLYTTKSFGTGLGIPAVEKTLELHGGGLDIASRVGHGTTFTIWLPLTSPSQSAAA